MRTITEVIKYRRQIMPTTPAKKKYKQKLARRIAQSRDDADLSQAEIAAALGVAEGTYAKWEKDDGSRAIPHEHIAPFCLATGKDPWYILTGRNKP